MDRWNAIDGRTHHGPRPARGTDFDENAALRIARKEALRFLFKASKIEFAADRQY
jgi:hypothetical protein